MQIKTNEGKSLETQAGMVGHSHGTPHGRYIYAPPKSLSRACSEVIHSFFLKLS